MLSEQLIVPRGPAHRSLNYGQGNGEIEAKRHCRGDTACKSRGLGQDPSADCMLLQMEGWMDRCMDRCSTAQCHKTYCPYRGSEYSLNDSQEGSNILPIMKMVNLRHRKPQQLAQIIYSKPRNRAEVSLLTLLLQWKRCLCSLKAEHPSNSLEVVC